VRRFRPITLTAADCGVGVDPPPAEQLLRPNATALMGGITVATILTLVYLPALYALWFRVRRDEPAHQSQRRCQHHEIISHSDCCSVADSRHVPLSARAASRRKCLSRPTILWIVNGPQTVAADGVAQQIATGRSSVA